MIQSGEPNYFCQLRLWSGKVKSELLDGYYSTYYVSEPVYAYVISASGHGHLVRDDGSGQIWDSDSLCDCFNSFHEDTLNSVGSVYFRQKTSVETDD